MRYTPGDPQLERVFEIPDGSRTLSVEATPGGRLYFGEYFLNPERSEARIFGSEDGANWDVVHTFPCNTVRHVHSVVHDPYRGGEWVMTGDYGDEAGLWFTDDHFQTLRPVATGAQCYRAVSVVPLPQGLIVPMDSASETNWVQLYDPERDDLTRLQPLIGSVMHIGRAGQRVVLSTSVEPSTVNVEQAASLMACDPEGDLENWGELERAPKDLGWLGSFSHYFQYPTWLLPGGPGSDRWLFATGRGLRGRDGRLMRYTQEPAATRHHPTQENSTCAESSAGSTVTVA